MWFVQKPINSNIFSSERPKRKKDRMHAITCKLKWTWNICALLDLISAPQSRLRMHDSCHNEFVNDFRHTVTENFDTWKQAINQIHFRRCIIAEYFLKKSTCTSTILIQTKMSWNSVTLYIVSTKNNNNDSKGQMNRLHSSTIRSSDCNFFQALEF